MDAGQINLRLEGLELNGKYRFIRCLGRGGFAEVWLAEEMDPTRRRIHDVAIKLWTSRADDRTELSRTFTEFAAELHIFVKLSEQAAVVRYITTETFDLAIEPSGSLRSRSHTQRTLASTASDAAASASTEDSLAQYLTLFAIVMEYGDGGAVAASYREQHIVSASDATYLTHLSDVVTALRAVHSLGITHRDIKPTNLIHFRKENRIKLADLGIARTDGSPTGRTIGIGTPGYMSPESFAGGEGPLRDIYALGCTLFEIFTGRPAFFLPVDSRATTGPSVSTLDRYREVHENGDPPNAVEYAPSVISVRLSGVIQRMMSRDPAQRPQLDELLAALTEEKQLRFPTPAVPANQVQAAPLPQTPIQRSRFNVSPAFRSQFLGETAYLVFIDLEVPSEQRRGMLLGLAMHHFGDTFSLCEVFGRHDYVLRVWCDPGRQLVERFCEDVIRLVLEDNRRAVQVMACEDVTYPGLKSRLDDKPDVVLAKSKLNEAQLAPIPIHETRIGQAEKWLRDKGVYARKKAEAGNGRRIKAYTLISPRSNSVAQAEEEALFALIQQKLTDLRPNVVKNGLTLFRRRFGHVQSVVPRKALTNCSWPFVVKFVATVFDDLITVPSTLMRTLEHQELRTSTLIATNRLIIESDRVAPQ